jgi:predicted nucleotidyltransferase
MAEDPDVHAFVTTGAASELGTTERSPSDSLSASFPQRPELAELSAIIGEETVRLCLEKCEKLGAIILTGSLARGEATFVQEKTGWRVLGDADFFLVYRQTSRLPSDADLSFLASAIEERLVARGIRTEIGLGAVHPSYLRQLKPRIATYELRNSGRVLWGDTQILSVIPQCGVEEIWREDAWRMLCNRAVEFVASAPMEQPAQAEVDSSIFYAALKLMLDSATSYLVFAGAYEPTFQRRAARLDRLACDSVAASAAPFPLKPFAEQVSVCTEWKLSGSEKDGELRPEIWKHAVRYATALCRWELVQLTGAPATVSDDELWSRWASRLSVSQKARAWLSVARRVGWSRTRKNWPRWMRLSRRGTPRYLVYRAAAELLRRLSESAGAFSATTGTDSDLNGLRALLPERAPASPGREESWQSLAADLAWNYKKFLLGTDA